MNRQYTRAPHRSGATTEGYGPNAALLIDFDNVTMAIRSNLAQELEALLNSDIIRGKVAVQRAYADWRRYPQYIVPLSESSIDLIFAPAYGSSKKNATDIRLAIDALELVFTRPEIGTYILLSGDSDFSSLVLKLKEYGKYVIGVGLQESSSDILVQNCDEYYSYTRLSGLKEATEVDTDRHDPWELVERALQRMTDRSDVMRSDRLKQVMLELDPGFDEGAIGYSKFNRFLAEAASRDKVKLRKAANGQYEVKPVGGRRGSGGGEEDRPRVSRGRQERSRGAAEAKGRGRRRPQPEGASGDRGRGDGDGGAPEEDGGVSADALRSAYDLLTGAVRSLSNGEDSVRDSEVKRKMLADEPGFDEAALGFRKFSRFLQQAHDEGVIDLHQGEDGNYYLSAPAGARPASEEGRAGAGSGAKDRSKETGRGRPPRGGRGRRAGREATGDRQEREATTVPGPVEAAPAAEEAAPPSRPAATERTGRSRRGGLGRFRRGSRGGAEAPGPGGGSAPEIGPVQVGDEEAGAAEPEPQAGSRASRPISSEPDADRRGTEAASGASRRGLGRFRRGSRGSETAPAGPTSAGGGEAEAEGAEGSPARAEADDRTTGDGATGGQAEAVDHMVRNYPGVGERTASRLVDAFGDDVFDVIDRQPGRVEEVLSERRARAVIEAREAEKTSGRDGATE